MHGYRMRAGKQITYFLVARLREFLIPEADGIERAGVTAQTTSSTSDLNSSHVSTAAVGTATTRRAGWRCRTPCAAARIVDPVANLSVSNFPSGRHWELNQVPAV